MAQLGTLLFFKALNYIIELKSAATSRSLDNRDYILPPNYSGVLADVDV